MSAERSKKKPSKKKSSSQKQPAADADSALKGWTAIARYLGIPVGTAHRWASEGMPVRREGQFTVADREAVSAWLGRESHMPKPAHVMTEDADMAARSKSRLRQRASGNKVSPRRHGDKEKEKHRRGRRCHTNLLLQASHFHRQESRCHNSKG